MSDDCVKTINNETDIDKPEETSASPLQRRHLPPFNLTTITFGLAAVSILVFIFFFAFLFILGSEISMQEFMQKYGTIYWITYLSWPVINLAGIICGISSVILNKNKKRAAISFAIIVLQAVTLGACFLPSIFAFL